MEPGRGEQATACLPDVDHAQALIDALLTLARTQGSLTVTEPIDLATVAEDVLDTARGDAIQISTRLAPATTNGDPLLLERLVANLVDNALRYNTPNGAVAISTTATDRAAILRITNTGPTIAPGLVDSLFQPFTRAAGRTSHDGFGLGLALVHSITTTHHGTITATAPNSGGLDITVTLPHDGPG